MTTTMLEQKLERSSSFSVTCNRLSQYLRENGGLGVAPRPQPPPTNGLFRQPATMCLLPGAVVPADDPTTETTTDGVVVSGPKTRKSMNLFPQHAGFGAADDKKSELTILYGGKVLVFDDFPADKARDLMLMAGLGSFNSATSAAAPTVTPGQPTASAKHVPIARRASLHRFLEKRKDRINSKAPYQQVNSSAPTPALSSDSRR